MDGSPHLAIEYLRRQESRMHVYEGWYMCLTDPRYEELTMHVWGMCRLALGTLARVGKRTN